MNSSAGLADVKFMLLASTEACSFCGLSISWTNQSFLELQSPHVWVTCAISYVFKIGISPMQIYSFWSPSSGIHGDSSPVPTCREAVFLEEVLLSLIAAALTLTHFGTYYIRSVVSRTQPTIAPTSLPNCTASENSISEQTNQAISSVIVATRSSDHAS